MFELLIQLVNELMLLAGYIGGGNSFPKQLSAKEEKEYLELYKNGDMSARNTLIEHNLRLVAHITKKYSNDSNSEDLISVGIIGLIKGIDTFNSKKSTKLSSYIARCIENEVLMVLRSNKKLNNEVSLEECIGTDKEGNSMTFADILPADERDIVEDISIKSNVKKLYHYIDKVLKNYESEIIVNRYGLNGRKKQTQQEIADRMGISRSYVSRIEKKAIKKLTEAFQADNK